MNFLEDPDARLMAEVAAGNLDAFEQLVMRHQKSAWSLAYRFLGNAPDAEDVVQEAFLRILRAAPRYRAAAKFRTFLFSVVGNLCKDHLSKKRTVALEEAAFLRAPERNPEGMLGTQERAAAVRSALEARRGVLAVPLSAVIREQGKSVVYVLRGGRPGPQTVRVGRRDAERIEIVSGLNENDRVLVRRQVKPGSGGQ